MSETETNHAKPPRFPYVGALLCAACLGAAVWTWMRYSYCWTVTPEAFPAQGVDIGFASPFPVSLHAPSMVGRYVRLTGEVLLTETHADAVTEKSFPTPLSWCRVLVSGPGGAAYVRLADAPVVTFSDESRTYQGRVHVDEDAFGNDVAYEIDTTASRFHGASIAGLVVGAMGVFVFTVALRHWLRERRAASTLEVS